MVSGLVLVYGECQTDVGPIKNCCCLGYGNTHFNAKSSGVYTISNFGGVKCSNTRVYCDTTSGGGGWTVIQRRQDGSVDFNRDWVDYEDGFGSLTGEFWFGLRGMNAMTSEGQWELRIDYTFLNGSKGYLSYSNFRVGPATKQYPLTISGFDGVNVTTDPFYTIDQDDYNYWSLNGSKFTTRDRDNDKWDKNCAVSNHGPRAGGWWYNDCSALYLNHEYRHRFIIYLNGKYHVMPFIEIKIRPKDCAI